MTAKLKCATLLGYTNQLTNRTHEYSRIKVRGGTAIRENSRFLFAIQFVTHVALDAYQQAYRHLGNSKNILVVAGHKEIEDTFPASIALARVLTKNKKEITLFSSGSIPDHFSFLENEYMLHKAIDCAQDIVISLDASKKPVKQMSYNRDAGQLHIHITPESGTRIEEQDVHISLAKFNYDLIVTLGLDDLESLGEQFERNASFFFETPIIAIDKNSSNERYGQVNIVEPTLSSCSEITTTLLTNWSEDLITKEVATPLLAGIIATTNNFQNARTKPNTLHEAARLMSREANQQEIIKYLFKMKSFEFLKLWGIAMSKLQYREDSKLAWFTLEKSDFQDSGTSPKIILSVLAELKNNFATPTVFVLFWEAENSYSALVHTPHEEQRTLIAKSVGGERHGNNLVLALGSQDVSRREKIISDISRVLEESGV